jgi:hypothetical protein
MIGKIPQYFSHRPAFINYAIGGSTSYNILKTWRKEDDEYKLRPLTQLDGEGEPIILPSESPMDRDNIPFRRIRKRVTNDQIKVVDQGNDIEIQGNGKAGRLIWKDCEGNPTTLFEWVDGLIITEGDREFTAGCTATETPTDTPP